MSRNSHLLTSFSLHQSVCFIIKLFPRLHFIIFFFPHVKLVALLCSSGVLDRLKPPHGLCWVTWRWARWRGPISISQEKRRVVKGQHNTSLHTHQLQRHKSIREIASAVNRWLTWCKEQKKREKLIRNTQTQTTNTIGSISLHLWHTHTPSFMAFCHRQSTFQRKLSWPHPKPQVWVSVQPC